MSTNTKIILISAAIVVGIILFRYIVYSITNKGINAAKNAMAKKNNETHKDNAGIEEKLSDQYKDK